MQHVAHRVSDEVAHQSPIDSLVATFKHMVANRTLLNTMVHNDYWVRTLVELEMAVNEKDGQRVVGIVSMWVRREAVPVLRAHRALHSNGDVQERARTALQALNECSNAAVQTVCQGWIRKTYHV